jgi:hypothetical protein
MSIFAKIDSVIDEFVNNNIINERNSRLIKRNINKYLDEYLNDFDARNDIKTLEKTNKCLSDKIEFLKKENKNLKRKYEETDDTVIVRNLRQSLRNAVNDKNNAVNDKHVICQKNKTLRKENETLNNLINIYNEERNNYYTTTKCMFWVEFVLKTVLGFLYAYWIIMLYDILMDTNNQTIMLNQYHNLTETLMSQEIVKKSLDYFEIIKQMNLTEYVYSNFNIYKLSFLENENQCINTNFTEIKNLTNITTSVTRQLL